MDSSGHCSMINILGRPTTEASVNGSTYIHVTVNIQVQLVHNV